jgi:hypothetical protein
MEKSLSTSGILAGDPDASKLAIAKYGLCYAVKYGDVDVGVINAKASEVLRILEQFVTIKQEIAVDPIAFTKCLQTWKDRGKLPDLNLEVNIYGPSTIKQTIGQLLSGIRCYLQRPMSIPDNIVMDNPHWISFSSLSMENDERPKLKSALTAIEFSENQETYISKVLEGLDQEEHVEMAHIHSSITSNLQE